MGLFDGQVAWVTGAGRGIGRAAALALAEQGASIAIVSRTQSELDQTADEIKARGGKVLTSLLDVSNWDMVEWTAKQIESLLGPIDLLINNAGVLEPLGKLWETAPEEWTRLIDINVSGAYYCMRAVLPGMVKRDRGVVINISSGAATNAAPNWTAYAASKAALDQLTRTLAVDLKGTAVRTYSLHPGITESNMQHTLRNATADQLPPERSQFFIDEKISGNVLDPSVPAQAIVWLCSALCDLDNGAMIDLRSQPEYVEKITQALR
ncbi:MAG TPA: SDR family oxidoreductase [Anaerolineae bacterium]|nr:SDR family oxidoreductase [Anaerolineae bacterium]